MVVLCARRQAAVLSPSVAHSSQPYIYICHFTETSRMHRLPGKVSIARTDARRLKERRGAHILLKLHFFQAAPPTYVLLLPAVRAENPRTTTKQPQLLQLVVSN